MKKSFLFLILTAMSYPAYADEICGQLMHWNVGTAPQAQTAYFVTKSTTIRIRLLPLASADAESLLRPESDGLYVCAYGELKERGFVTYRLLEKMQPHANDSAGASNQRCNQPNPRCGWGR